MKTLIALFAVAAAGFAQAVPVKISVQWLNSDVVRAKYGKLPASIYPGEVTAVNLGATNIVFGQGTVIQALTQQNLPAMSRSSAIAVITAAQAGTFRSRWLQWSPVAVKGLSSINALVVLKAISVGPVVGPILATVGTVADQILPIVNSPLATNPYQTYDTDGMQNLMQLQPGDSLVGTIMFAVPGKPPAGTLPLAFTIQIPIAQK